LRKILGKGVGGKIFPLGLTYTDSESNAKQEEVIVKEGNSAINGGNLKENDIKVRKYFRDQSLVLIKYFNS
jgi:hypothetical protein